MLSFSTLLVVATQLVSLATAYGGIDDKVGPETIASRLLKDAEDASKRRLPMDTRGLRRLANETLVGKRSIFPSNGIKGVNIGSWFVFGENNIT